MKDILSYFVSRLAFLSPISKNSSKAIEGIIG